MCCDLLSQCSAELSQQQQQDHSCCLFLALVDETESVDRPPWNVVINQWLHELPDMCGHSDDCDRQKVPIGGSYRRRRDCCQHQQQLCCLGRGMNPIAGPLQIRPTGKLPPEPNSSGTGRTVRIQEHSCGTAVWRPGVHPLSVVDNQGLAQPLQEPQVIAETNELKYLPLLQQILDEGC